MKKIKILITMLALSSFVPVVLAGSDCKSVNGRVTSTVVGVFSSGEPCSSPLALCTEGRFTGNMKGPFTFTASSLNFYQALDPASPPDVAATTGILGLNPKICEGSLVFKDTSTFSLGADGYFVSIGTVDKLASTGSCAETDGRIRIEGVFMEGCVDCRYAGEICGLDDNDE